MTGLAASDALAQSASPSQPDSALRSLLSRIEADLQADDFYPVRVASRSIGRFEGHELLLRRDTVVVIDRGSERAIALADIDSVWVRKDAARGLGILGGALCAFVGGVFGGVIATDPDSGSGSPVGAIAIGATFGGAICGLGGWLLGSFIQTWRLDYPQPLDPPPNGAESSTR
jgi:hypothetical protein